MRSPRTFVSSSHQVAGHVGALSSVDNEVFAKPTSQQEIDFYENTRLNAQKDPSDYAGERLLDWMPLYMGALTEGADILVESKMVLEPVDEDRMAVEAARRSLRDESLLKNGDEGSKTSEEPSKNDQKPPESDRSNPESAIIVPHNGAIASQNTPKDSQKVLGPEKVPDLCPQKYVVLQNLYHGFVRPSIIDIKLGSVLTDELASSEKARRLAKVSETTTSGSLGFRICGMKLFNANAAEKPSDIFPDMSQTISVVSDETGTYLQFNKIFGRLLTKDTVVEGLGLFFGHIQDEDVSLWLMRRFHQRLQLLYNCLLDEEIRVISGSLLLIYETDMDVWAQIKQEDSFETCDPLVQEAYFDDSDDETTVVERKAPLSSLHVIDFSHAKHVPGEGPDENIVEGVENLISLVGKMLDDKEEN